MALELSAGQILNHVMEAYGQRVAEDRNWLRLKHRLEVRGMRASDGSRYFRAFLQEIQHDGLEHEVHLVTYCLGKISFDSMNLQERNDRLQSSIRKLIMASSAISPQELEGHSAALSLLRRAASLPE